MACNGIIIVSHAILWYVCWHVHKLQDIKALYVWVYQLMMMMFIINLDIKKLVVSYKNKFLNQMLYQSNPFIHNDICRLLCTEFHLD